MADQTIKTETKAATLDYGPPPLRLGERLARRLPSGEQVASFFKQFVWVAPLTLLIWVYAEREQVVTQPGITIPIDVQTSDHGRTVRLRRPDDKLIVVELSGSRASMDRVRALLKPNDQGIAPIVINVDQKLAVGGKDLQTVNEIANHPIFVNNGISVKSAQPPYLYVDIDEYEERDLPVRAPDEVAGKLTEKTTFDPKNVRVRAPSQVFKAAEAKRQLVVYADLAKREELKSGGKSVSLSNVPVYWSQRENVTLSPATVTANLDMRQSDGTFEIRSVPIHLVALFLFNDRFTVTFKDNKDSVLNVWVTGPAEKIELLRSGAYKPRALLDVQVFDANEKSVRRPLTFDLPTGVTLLKEKMGDEIDWEFSVTARNP